MDGGDEIQGTIMTDDIANGRPDAEHPVMTAINKMGYDAMTLGNHEFNWGIVDYFQKNSPVEPALNHNWRITGVDLCLDDPRREEIIGYIREGLLPTLYNKSYNLADYNELVAEAEANRAAKGTDETQKNDP